jgi:hypothetical protein
MGIMPLAYMLEVMRDPAADNRRPDAMAMAAAPYLHPKVNAVDASPAAVEPSLERRSIEVKFIVPGPDHAREDEGGG